MENYIETNNENSEAPCGTCGWCKNLMPDLIVGSTGICKECLHKYFPEQEKSILKKMEARKNG